MAYASPSARLKDLTGGIEFYRVVSRITDHYEEEKEDLVRKLGALAKRLFRADSLMISYTAAAEGLAGIEEQVKDLKEKLFTEPVEPQACILHCEKLQILKVIMSYEYLWQNIRVKGGAYGCMSNFNRIGEGFFVSYRDPNLKRTMEVYEGVPEYLRNFTVSERDMTKYIIGTISNIDQPMTPAAKGDRSMNLYMNHVSEEMIRKEREEILEAGQEDIRALADVAEAVLAAGQVCVIGSEEAIDAEKEMFGTVTRF